MIINHNISAMNTYRQLTINNSLGSKSLERLSSGLRINRAGADAAGLAISEKMRGQIRGLNMAAKNAQDGISLIQTAEGALNETHSILQRMRELAVQSASDTNTGVDRGEIQKEIDELAKEITRISTTTEFNTQGLLNGKFDAKFHIGANEGQNVDLSIGNMGAAALRIEGKVYAADITGVNGLQVISRSNEPLKIVFKASATTGNDAVPATTAEFNKASGTITITLKQDAGTEDAAGDITATYADVKTALESVAADAGIEVATLDTFASETIIATAPTPVTVNWSVDAELSKEYGIDVSTQEKADAAITLINNAIETVSAERSKLGAMQNRLEHTINNLSTAAENLQAAESRIRDVDMAKEMMEFTKNNILQQAATAMLAQANMMPQTVLQLLR
ncbi:MAG: flagellin [Firmicutes bacterium]|nr:flagellin [Bacillota bacterium]